MPEVQGRTLSPAPTALGSAAAAASPRELFWTNLPKAVVLRRNVLERARGAEQPWTGEQVERRITRRRSDAAKRQPVTPKVTTLAKETAVPWTKLNREV